MRRLILSAMAALTLLLSVGSRSVYGQFSYRQTVGSENAIPYFEPMSEEQVTLGVIRRRGAIISNPNLTQGASNHGNLTRHSSLTGSTGIGGSSLETESVTSESRPALARPFGISTGAPLIARPVITTGLDSLFQSPALRGFQIQYPSVDEPNPFETSPETFTNSSILPSSAGGAFSSAADDFQFGP